MLAALSARNIPQSPLNNMSALIETTLSDHGVMVEVKDIKAGPRIIRFGLVPGWQIKKGDNGKVENFLMIKKISFGNFHLKLKIQ